MVREERVTRLASPISRINPVDQCGDRSALTSNVSERMKMKMNEENENENESIMPKDPVPYLHCVTS